MDYTVKQGDTLNSIAKAQGFKDYKDAGITSVPSGNFDLIRPGEKINIGNAKKQPDTVGSSPVTNPTDVSGTQKNPPIDTGTSNSTQVRDTINKTGITPTPDTSFEQFQKDTMANIPDKPTAPNQTDTWTAQRAALGVPAIEDNINEYNNQIATLQQQLKEFTQSEPEGESAGFAAGRISEAQQNIQNKIDEVTIQANYAQSKLTTANNFIQTLMGFQQTDYQNANADYQFEFNKNIQLQNAFTSQENKVMNDARATLTTMNNLISNSGKSYSELSPDMQAQVNQLEMSAGMPIGTMSAFSSSKPKAQVITTSTVYDAQGNASIAIVSRDPDTGAITVSNMPTGGVKPQASAALNQQIEEQIATPDFQALSPDDQASYIESLGGDPSNFTYSSTYTASQ